MATKSKTIEKTSLAALVAHEDLRIGDYVSVLNETFEVPSFFWCDTSQMPVDEPVRLRYCARNAGRPLRVKAICLPFVHVKTPVRSTRILDVRKVQLVRLQKRYAKIVWKDLCKRQKKKKKSGR